MARQQRTLVLGTTALSVLDLVLVIQELDGLGPWAALTHRVLLRSFLLSTTVALVLRPVCLEDGGLRPCEVLVE